MKTPVKKLLLMATLCLCFCNYLKAQYIVNGKEIDTSYNTQMNHLFGNLDKSKIPYGILKDYGMGFTNLSRYDGTNMGDSTLIDKSVLFQIYNTLLTSRLTAAAYLTLPKSNIIDSTWFTYRKPGQVAICGLFYQYAYLNDNALSSNKITFSAGQLFDKYSGAVWQNPYVEANAIGFTPAIKAYMGQDFNILLPDSLWLSNSKGIVNHIEIDANDGLGYRTITPNTPLPVSYADTGLKTWNFKLYLTNSTVLQSHSYLKVNADTYDQNHLPPPLDEGSRRTNMAVNSTTSANNIVYFYSSETFGGKHAYGEVTVQLAPNHSSIQKPLIIVEGFDPGIYTTPEVYTGSSSLTEFKFALSGSISLTNLLNSSISEYDLIYIDYRNGTEDIRLNALLVKDVIRWVNSVKQPLSGHTTTEKNVVIGQSMGGLVARYALKKMEDASEIHDTRLYINHDGPQQGANVPVGYQYLVNHVDNLYLRYGSLPAGAYEIVKFVANLFDPDALGPNIIPGALSVRSTPAAKQMLINYIDDSDNLTNSVHNAWQTELTNLGYPSQDSIRNIAISNGSECATPQVVGNGGTLLSINGEFTTKLLGQLISVVGFGAGIIGEPKLLVGFAPGKDKITVNFQANASSTFGGNQVYSGNIHYKKTLFGATMYSSDLTNRVKSAASGNLGFENFGGSFVHQKPISTTPVNTWFYQHQTTVSGPIDFCFVPTPSALDISGNPSNLSQADYLKSYSTAIPPVAPKASPFVNFTTAYNGGPNNEDHITFTSRNGDWLANELNKKSTPTENCAALCGDFLIAGPDYVCASQSYSIAELPLPGVHIKWTTSGGIGISGNDTLSTVTISKLFNGYGTLYATITTACGSKALTPMLIYAGLPVFPAYTTNPLPLCGDQPFTFTAILPNGSSILSATGTSDGVEVPLNATSPTDFDVPYDVFRITLTIQNHCGTSTVRKLLLKSNCALSSFIAFPNPANTELTVQDNAKSRASHKGQQITLYNKEGRVLRSFTLNTESKVVFDTRAIPNGTYILHIVNGSKVIEKQIIINH